MYFYIDYQSFKIFYAIFDKQIPILLIIFLKLGEINAVSGLCCTFTIGFQILKATALTTIIEMKTMKFCRIAYLMLAALSFASCSSDEKDNPITTDSTQLLPSPDPGFSRGERQRVLSRPRMHIEGDTLYICTSQGLYARILTDDNGIWQQAGFNGIPLHDYTRRGSDILALRYNNEGYSFLLLSHDNGQTYEDVTPDIFRNEEHEQPVSLVQHPTDPNTLLVASLYKGVFRSIDYGQTWEQLTEYVYGNRAAYFIGFHPAKPNIIYNSGEDMFLQGHINITYDGGQTWNDHGNSLGFPGDNCVHQIAFHPTNPDHWIAGGEGCVFLSDDNGQTWNCQNYWDDEARSAYWYFTAFDDEYPDTVYIAGWLGRHGLKNACIKILCSTDGGRSWYESYEIESKRESDRVTDLQQYHDRLLIYTESGVYTLSKADLIVQSTVASAPSP